MFPNQHRNQTQHRNHANNRGQRIQGGQGRAAVALELVRVLGVRLLIHLLAGRRVNKERERTVQRQPQEQQRHNVAHQNAGTRKMHDFSLTWTIHWAARSIHGNLTGLNIRAVRIRAIRVSGGGVRFRRIRHGLLRCLLRSLRRHALRKRLLGTNLFSPHLRGSHLSSTHVSRTHIGVQRVTAYGRLRRVKATRSLHRLIRTVVTLRGTLLGGGNRLRDLNGGAVGARQRAGRTDNFCRVLV